MPDLCRDGMGMRVLAAIASGQTDLPGNLRGLDKAKNKIHILKLIIRMAYLKMKMQKNLAPGNPPEQFQYIFLAPEYFFSNSTYGKAGDRFFDHHTKRYIISELHALSALYPDLLIVPGTVVWTKDAWMADPDNPGNSILRGRRVLNAMDRLGDLASKLQRHDFAIEKEGFNTHNWSYSGPKYHNMTADYLMDADRLHTKIAQNVAYLCLNGTIKKYAKVGNFQEVEGESQTIVYAPGSIAGKFKVGHVGYSIEICRDHALGVIDSSAGGNNAVIRLIVSNWIPNMGSFEDNTLVLHASTMPLFDGKGAPSGVLATNTRSGGPVEHLDTTVIHNNILLHDFRIDEDALGISRHREPIDNVFTDGSGEEESTIMAVHTHGNAAHV